MALISQLVRGTRTQEVPGCPLDRPRAGAPETACSGCPYNALWPESPRIGCMIETPFSKWKKAAERLRAISPADHAKLTAILEHELASPDPLSREALAEAHAILARWWRSLSSDADEREVVGVLLRMADYGAKTKEPIRILA